MGRWAQRRLAGGGPPLPVDLIQIVSAVIDGTNFILLTYSAAVDIGDFLNSDFETVPNVRESIDITDPAANELYLEYSGGALAETAITYHGTAPGILTPQTIALT